MFRSNFRVMALLPGQEVCLLALGETPQQAIELSCEPAAEIEDILAADRGRIRGAQLEVWVQRENRNAFWRRVRGVALFRELGLVQKSVKKEVAGVSL